MSDTFRWTCPISTPGSIGMVSTLAVECSAAMNVDCAFYSRGSRQPSEGMTLEDAASCPRRGNNYVWIELHEPDAALMAEVSRHFGLHELAVEDAAHAHQRPKVEPYDDFYFIVYKAARYDEPTNRVLFTELDLFLGVGCVIAVRHGERSDPERARRHLEQHHQLISVLEAHLSLISLRQSEIAAEQNQVVRRLTVVATIFLPLTFVTGFYGQNFGWLVRHVNSFAAFVVLGLGVLVGLSLAIFGLF